MPTMKHHNSDAVARINFRLPNEMKEVVERAATKTRRPSCAMITIGRTSSRMRSITSTMIEHDLSAERENFQNSTAEFFQLKPRATIRTFAHSDHSLVTQRGEILVCNPSGFFDLLARLMKLA